VGKYILRPENLNIGRLEPKFSLDCKGGSEKRRFLNGLLFFYLLLMSIVVSEVVIGVSEWMF